MSAALLALAKSLGLVDIIDVRQQNNNSKSTGAATKQHYQYLIVIDFEATCWEKDEAKWRKPEIIEFPATLIATETGRILSEFHEYVQPIECGQISEFCTRLTGITQTQCDSAAPLRTVLAQFNEWLRRVAAEHRLTLPKSSAKNKLGNTVLLSWSDWDFGVCLANECSRKGIQKAAYFDQWCDLRAVYKEFQQYRPKNFSDALQNVGMEFIGRPHCGRDDARMTARLAVELAKKGALINVTKDLKPFIVFNKQF